MNATVWTDTLPPNSVVDETPGDILRQNEVRVGYRDHCVVLFVVVVVVLYCFVLAVSKK